jgi:hypothetical protein
MFVTSIKRRVLAFPAGQMIDMEHALVTVAQTINREFLEAEFGAVYKEGASQPPLPTRLMAGLAILKHTSLQPRRRADGAQR